jgi:hypothetical protein
MRAPILEMTERPALARALWWATLVDEAVLREWVVNIGTRDAPERIAHLLAELLVRMRAVGLVTSSDRYKLPITQEQLAQTVGISAVHANRALQTLRRADLIRIRDKSVEILDVERLFKMSGFTSNYLHLGQAEHAPRPALVPPKSKRRWPAIRQCSTLGRMSRRWTEHEKPGRG